MPHVNGKPEAALAAGVLDSIPLPPNPGEVERYLGYPSGAVPEAGIRDRLYRMLDESWGAARPSGVYAIYRVEHQDLKNITLAGGAAFHGSIGEFLGGARRVAAFVVTAGPQLPELADAAMKRRDFLGGLLYNAIGSAVADLAAYALVEALRPHLAPGEALTMPYSPGYCGMSISQQRTVFGLVDAGRVGVELLPTYIMKPVKSVSGIIGMGPEAGITAFGNPCAKCPLEECRMRR